VNLSIDVIIPTYDRPSRVPPLVGFLAGQLTPSDHVYIIWQGAMKPEARDFPNVHYIQSSPPNLPKARNRGIAEGSGEICLFFDDDVEILNFDILELHRNAYAREKTGVVAGYIDDPFLDKRSGKPSMFDEMTGEIVQNFSVDQSQDTVSVMGAHMSFKRQALMDVGGFDEHFRANALWEEVDCAFRVRRAGWKIFYCAEARVKHLHEQKGGCRRQREQSIGYMYHQFANTAYFAGRYAQPKYYRSWLLFWKYRLEFLSRKKWFFLEHDPWLAGAGIAGALGGIVRYVMQGKKI
jgi:GT2 family glycosyltransferase